MAGPRPLRLLTRLQAEQQVQQLLWQLRGEDAFAGGPWQTGAAARAVWRQLEEDLAGAAAPADARLQILHRLLCSRLEERGLLTRPMLCRLAIRQLEQGRAALPAREFARLDCVRLTRLEQALWDALTRGREQVLPLPDGSLEELAARLRPRCRFVACRSAENQIRWILHDLARAGAAPDSAAVAVASGKTAVQLWQEGQRVGLPVAVDGGLPLSGCPLAALLRGLDAWRQQGYEAETLIDLLGYPGFATLRPALLIRQLRRRLVAFGPGRYELLWAEEDADLPADAHALWQAFFRCLLAALTPGDGQKQALGDLLADYGHAAGAGSGAALAQVRALLAQLEPQAGQDLLCLLLDAIEGSRYLSSGPRPGALFCAGFARCLGCGVDTLYVTGLSAAELLGTPKPLAFGGQSALPEEPAADSLRRLLFSACGRVVLLRPAYTVEDLLERSPALLYTRLLEGCGAAEETFGFADQPQLPPACPPPPARGVLPAPARTYPELAGWLLQTPLSATALETALQCPYRFMLQYLLQISADQPLPPAPHPLAGAQRAGHPGTRRAASLVRPQRPPARPPGGAAGPAGKPAAGLLSARSRRPGAERPGQGPRPGGDRPSHTASGLSGAGHRAGVRRAAGARGGAGGGLFPVGLRQHRPAGPGPRRQLDRGGLQDRPHRRLP